MAWLINEDEVKLFYAALFRSFDTSVNLDKIDARRVELAGKKRAHQKAKVSCG
jgi:hypothetical protein